MMKVTYPNFLRDQDETTAKRLWWTHIENIDPVNEFPKFAPTIGEFKKLCRGQASAQQTPQGLPICPKCRSYTITQRHYYVCETGSVQPEVFARVEPGEARKALAELLGW